jgi:tetratricopeptide (TPR) repeat protein
MKLREAARLEAVGRLVTNRCYLDLATTLKELAFSEGADTHLSEAKLHFWRALYESEALGHHRNVGSVENNIGFLLLSLGFCGESERHLLRSRRIFEALSDSVRGAQVNDTLARLYVETKQLTLAQEVIDRAVNTLEMTDSEAILAEALTTKGIVESRRTRYGAAKRSFEAAYKIAGRCGDVQGAARALLAHLEEMQSILDRKDALELASRASELLRAIPQPSILARIEKVAARIVARRKDAQ